MQRRKGKERREGKRREGARVKLPARVLLLLKLTGYYVCKDHVLITRTFVRVLIHRCTFE